MGFRFRKSVKILPGIKLNFGKKGSSVSVGGSGATINISKRGTKTTIGIPGTGISYSENLSNKQGVTNSKGNAPSQTSSGVVLKVLIIGFIILAIIKLFIR